MIPSEGANLASCRFDVFAEFLSQFFRGGIGRICQWQTELEHAAVEEQTTDKPSVPFAAGLGTAVGPVKAHEVLPEDGHGEGVVGSERKVETGPRNSLPFRICARPGPQGT